jgi:hypothetical protein
MVSMLTVSVYLVDDSALHLCRRSTLTGLPPGYRSGIHTEDLRHRFVRKPSMHAIKPELVSEGFRPLVRTVSEEGYDRCPVVDDWFSLAVLPVYEREEVKTDPQGNIRLSQPQVQAFRSDMIAYRL